MKLLAFDTSTEHLSIAVSWLLDGRDKCLSFTGPGGATASTTLIPQVLRLMAEAGWTFGMLDAIVFGAGPGSFTGLRTACSVTQGLAFGADVPVLPADTLQAVAEETRYATGASRVHSVLDARMDEVYAARHGPGTSGALVVDRRLRRSASRRQLSWSSACGRCRHGSSRAMPSIAYGGRLLSAQAVPSTSRTADAASAMLRLAPALLACRSCVLPAANRPCRTTFAIKSPKPPPSARGRTGSSWPRPSRLHRHLPHECRIQVRRSRASSRLPANGSKPCWPSSRPPMPTPGPAAISIDSMRCGLPGPVAGGRWRTAPGLCSWP
jgi:tRNA threonylcarbamoyladenosine biosynthesis protein TsaB